MSAERKKKEKEEEKRGFNKRTEMMPWSHALTIKLLKIFVG
jgi:hypothetical protein